MGTRRTKRTRNHVETVAGVGVVGVLVLVVDEVISNLQRKMMMEKNVNSHQHAPRARRPRNPSAMKRNPARPRRPRNTLRQRMMTRSPRKRNPPR